MNKFQVIASECETDHTLIKVTTTNHVTYHLVPNSLVYLEVNLMLKHDVPSEDIILLPKEYFDQLLKRQQAAGNMSPMRPHLMADFY